MNRIGRIVLILAIISIFSLLSLSAADRIPERIEGIAGDSAAAETGKTAEASPTPEATPAPTPEPVHSELVLKNDNLPDDYQLTDYTFATNTNAFSQTYIDTGVIPTNNTRVYFDFECTSGFIRKDTWFFGAFDRDHNMFMEVGFHQSQGNVAHFYTATNFHYSQFEDSAARTVATFDPGDYTFEEPVRQTLYIFSRQHMDHGTAGTEDTWGEYSLRVYTCRLWQDGILVRDYVPCYCISTGEVGMFDLAEGKMYGSAGTELFEKGEDVAPPTVVHAVNGQIEETVSVPEIDGFEFQGYFTEYGGKGIECIDKDGKQVSTEPTAENRTLYAYWTRTNEEVETFAVKK